MSKNRLKFSGRNVAELLATARKTFRFAEAELGITTYEYDQPSYEYINNYDNARVTVYCSQFGIIDPKLDNLTKPPYHYVWVNEFRYVGGAPFRTYIAGTGFLEEICTFCYTNGGSYQMQQKNKPGAGFSADLLSPPEEEWRKIAPKTMANASGEKIYDRQMAKYGVEERYEHVEGAHMLLARSILTHAMAERGGMGFDQMVSYCDNAMDVLKPQDYAATYADKVNRQPLRPQVPPRRKIFGLF